MLARKVGLGPADKPINTSGWGEPITVAPDLARVSIPAVRRAVAEYVTTGQRPTFLDWSPEPAAGHDE